MGGGRTPYTPPAKSVYSHPDGDSRHIAALLLKIGISKNLSDKRYKLASSVVNVIVMQR